MALQPPIDWHRVGKRLRTAERRQRRNERAWRVGVYATFLTALAGLVVALDHALR